MPRPKNTELRDQIRRRYAELLQEYPVGGVNFRKLLSEEMGASLHTVNYHLKTKQDARTRYTEEERNFFAQASYSELKEWAEIHKKPFSTVYSVALRCRKASKAQTPQLFKSRSERIEQQGYFDIGSSRELYSFGFNRADVKIAKDTILKKVGLVLTSPNLLLQKDKGRHVALSISEEIAILKDPTHFLTHTARAGGFKDRWVETMEYIYVIEVEFKAMETDTSPAPRVVAAIHELHAEAATALRAMRRYTPVLNPRLRTLKKGTVHLGEVLA